MRSLGLVLILAAIAVGLVWPWAQINLQGRAIETLQFGNLQGPIVERRTLDLTENDNPVRARFQASFVPGGALPPLKLPVKVVITDRDGTLLTGVISFPTNSRNTGPENVTVSAGTMLNFNTINDGPHEMFLELAPNPDDGGISRPALEGISVSFVGNAPQLRDDYKALAAVMALAGFYLLVRSRRKKKKDGETPPPNWGRGD